MTRVIPTNRRLSLPGSPRWWIVTALVAASMVVLDAWSKSWVERVLGPSGARESVEIVGQFVELHYGRNSGVAFGLLSGSSGLAAALVATVIVPLTVVLLVLASKGPAWAVAAGLLLGGAAGNLVDRAGDQTVTDFISVGRWPSFNLADSAITLGSLMLIALSYRDRNTETQHVT